MAYPILFASLLVAAAATAAPKRVLYVTHSAGFVHGSIPVSERVLEQVGRETGVLDVTVTQDLSRISTDGLRDVDVLFFFTSGELALSDAQKRALLDFVRGGKGFGGVHSATDTLYTWPEYGELVGAIFNGHPWAQEVTIDVEDPDHPAMRGLAPSFRIADEIYQVREISRDRVRVLMTLDTRSVDMKAPGVDRTDEDFALAWCRNYGEGRVFYTALGHGDETWLDPRFQTLIKNALLWLAREVEGDAAPRVAVPAVSGAAGAGGTADRVVAPGSLIAITGERFTAGARLDAVSTPLPVKLAGVQVRLDGALLPLASAAPDRILAQVPFGLPPGGLPLSVSGAMRQSPPVTATVERTAPGIVAVVRAGSVWTIYCTGLGEVTPGVPTGAAAPREPLSVTQITPEVTIGGERAAVEFSGLAPLQVGLYQINTVIQRDVAGPIQVVLTADGRASEPFNVP